MGKDRLLLSGNRGSSEWVPSRRDRKDESGAILHVTGEGLTDEE